MYLEGGGIDPAYWERVVGHADKRVFVHVVFCEWFLTCRAAVVEAALERRRRGAGVGHPHPHGRSARGSPSRAAAHSPLGDERLVRLAVKDLSGRYGVGAGQHSASPPSRQRRPSPAVAWDGTGRPSEGTLQPGWLVAGDEGGAVVHPGRMYSGGGGGGGGPSETGTGTNKRTVSPGRSGTRMQLDFGDDDDDRRADGEEEEGEDAKRGGEDGEGPAALPSVGGMMGLSPAKRTLSKAMWGRGLRKLKMAERMNHLSDDLFHRKYRESMERELQLGNYEGMAHLAAGGSGISEGNKDKSAEERRAAYRVFGPGTKPPPH